MKDTAWGVAKDYVTLFLTGLGITFAPHEYLGGLFLALAAATFAAHIRPEKDRVELGFILLGGFLSAHLAAILGPKFLPNMPVQLLMAGAGFGSRYIARTVLAVLGLIETKSDKIADRVIDRVIPGKKD